MSNIVISPQSGVIEFNNGTAGSSSFSTSTAPIRLDATGGNVWFTGSNVGIGTTNPTAQLHVHGSAGALRIHSSAGGANVYLESQAGNLSRVRWNGLSNFAIRDDNDNADRLVVTTDGDIVANDSKKFKGTTYTSSYLSFADDTTLSANSDIIFDVNGSTELMRLEEGGNVGIGTTSPVTLLDVDGAANHGIRIGTNNALIGEGGTTGTQLIFWNGTSAYYGRSAAPFTHTVSNHFFRVGGNDIAMIGSAGVGIGTASPAHQLHLNKENAIAEMQISRDGSDPSTDTDIGRIQFKTDYSSSPNEVGSIWVRTNSSAYRTDMRFGVKATAGSEEVGLTIHGTNDGPLVGVGTTNPQTKLTVDSDGDEDGLEVRESGDLIFKVRPSSSHGYLSLYDSSTNEDIRLNSNGNSWIAGGSLGVGMSSPSARLELKGGTSDSSANAFIARNSSSTSLLSVRNDGRVDIPLGPVNIGDTLYLDNNEIWAKNSNNLNVKADGLIRIQPQSYGTAATFATDGNVGIGSSSPAYKLDVDGTIHGTSGNFETAITINGNPVVTGSSASEGDTLATVTARGATTSSNLTLNGDITVASSKYIGIGSTLAAIQFGDGSVGNETADLSFVTNSDGEITFNRGGNAAIIGADFNIYKDTTIEKATPILKLDGTSNAEVIIDGGSSSESLIRFKDNGAESWILRQTNSDNQLAFRRSSTDYVVLDNAGKVGIGTTGPAQKLDVDGYVQVQNSADSSSRLYLKGGRSYFLTSTAGSDFGLYDDDVSAYRLYVKSDGNVGIGTTDPLGTTHIYTADAGGTIATNASHDDLIIENNGNCGIQLSSPASSYQYLAFGDTASANQGYVRYYHSSDRMDLRAGGSDILSLVGSKVGIGTTNPQEELDLRGDMRLDSGGTTDRSIYFRNQSSIAKVRSDAALQFDVGVSSSPSAAMYIQEDTRYVGIGTTGPVAKLEVQTSSLAEIATGLLIHNNVATTSTAGNGVSITMGRAGGVYSSKIANVWTNNNPSYLQTNIAFYTMHDSYAAGSETEKMRLTSQGRLGIGVTNPSQRLEVVTNTDASAQIGRAHIGYVGFADHAGFAHLDNASTSNYSLLQSSAGDTFINSVASRHIYFRDGNTTIGGFNSDDDFYVDTDALYVDVSASRVGINEDSVDATLHMTNVGGGVVNQKFERAGASAWRLGIPNGQTYFAFDDANDDLSTAKVVITKTDGNVGIGLTDPDQKLHVSENIRVGDGGASDYNRIDFTRYGGAVVGGIGWHTDAHFYVAGHPSVGPTAGNTVRVYGFGADVRLGDSVNGDVLTVDATNGNVGIGTTTPYGQVDIFSSNNTETDPDDAANYHLHLHNPLDDTSESIGIGFGLTSAHDAVGAAIAHERKGSNSYGDLYFSTRPDGGSVTERMRINSAGNVGIGSTSPAKTLTVDGSIGGTAFGIADGKGLLVDGSPSDNQYARFTANGLEGRSTANVLSDIGAQATIDASSRLSATLVGANGNVSNTEYGYLNGVTSAIQTQLNDRYTESEIQTFMDHSYISKEGASDLAVGWYTIATNAGNRATARFGIWDTDSSRHQSVTFYAAHKYGNAAADTITVLDTSHYGTSPFRYIRIKAGGTYDGAALQVYIDNAQNALNAAILGDNFQSDSWVLCDFIPDADTPPLVSNYGSFSESSRIDLDEIAQGGFATTGPIYADGNTTQYKVITTNDFGISNTDPVKIDSSSVADNEYARFTANGLESRSTSEVRSDISAMPSAGNSSTEVQFATVTTPVIAFGSLAYYSPTAGKRAFTQLSTDYNYYSIGSTVNSFSAGSTCVPIYGDGSYWRVG